MRKCTICNKKEYGEVFSTDGYTEPPEELYQCENCGFTAYYMYGMESHEYYMQTFKKDEKEDYFYQVEKYMVDSSVYKSECPTKEYKKHLIEELKKEGKTIQDFILLHHEAIKEREEWKENKIKLKQNEDKRLKNGEYTLEEQAKISEFVLENNKTIENFIDIGVLKWVNETLTYGDEYEKYISDKYVSQKEMCVKNGTPMFSSSRCYRCNTSIFGIEIKKEVFLGKEYVVPEEYISMEKAKTTSITGCPSCSASYVD